jgi:PAS domain S-box-containing protein
MSNAIIENETEPVSVMDKGAPDLRRAFLLALGILVFTVVLSAGLYVYQKRVFHERAVRAELSGGLGATEANFEFLRSLDSLAFTTGLLTVVGGGGALLSVVFAVFQWRRKASGQLQQQAEQNQVSTAVLQSQLAEARKAKESLVQGYALLEDRIQGLTREKSKLEEELDRRNRAERALAQRRQELESSKSVLELHVQARTEELQSLQRRYEMILNSAGEGICGLDTEDRATFVNPTVAKLTGWSVADLIGKSEQEIFLQNGAQRNGAPSDLLPDERVFYRRDGSWFPVEFVKTPLVENGRVMGSVLVFKDITERKRSDESLSRKAAELARSNAELEQFAFVASHDLQEPLRKIQAFGDRLKVKCEGLGSLEAQDYLERMQNAAARMRTLINDLLAFSRVIRSSEPFVKVDLGGVTREVLSDLEVRIEKSNARVEVGQLPTLEADPMQMRQLMLNLLSNALKFQAPGAVPVVKVSARTFQTVSGESLCELQVQDNGIGFDEKYLDKIFAVFQRLHGRSEYEGTGVGLAVCRRIVDRHHGSIQAHSQPGQGATFTVTLPIAQAGERTAA